VVWVMVPEVALIVTAEVPVGVPGTALLELEQPAMNPAEMIKTPNRAKRRMERCWWVERRRENTNAAPKGRSRAVVIPAVATPRIVCGRKNAVPFTVEMVTVLVAGALAATVKDAGEKEHLAARGTVLHVRVTVPLKLLVGTALTTAVAEEPSATVRVEVEALKP
jgi:hypothetical protein